MTQEELAESLFVSRTAISKWESGRGYPSIDSLKEISRFFSVTIDDLICSDEMVTVAENDKKVFALLNHPNENKEAVYWNDYNEMVIYDFDKAPSQWSEWELSDTIIDGQTCKMYKDKYFDSYLIEGIGYVDKKFYDLTNIYDFTTNEDSFVGMSHVENAAGEVIFKGPLYQKYDVKQPMLGDTNDDERIDVEDVNESINMVLRGDRIPFMRRVDMNGDGKVDVEDVNALINIILKVE